MPVKEARSILRYQLQYQYDPSLATGHPPLVLFLSTGWGNLGECKDKRRLSDILQEVELKILSNQDCENPEDLLDL